MPQDLEAKLREIFSVVLELPDDKELPSVRQLACDTWDSLATVSLMAAVESEFGLTLQAADQDRFTSYQSVLLLLRERTG